MFVISKVSNINVLLNYELESTKDFIVIEKDSNVIVGYTVPKVDESVTLADVIIKLLKPTSVSYFP